MYTGQEGLGPDNLNLRKVNTFSRNVDVRTHLAYFLLSRLRSFDHCCEYIQYMLVP